MLNKASAKILISMALISLIAAGCSSKTEQSTSNSSNSIPSQNQTVKQTPNPTPSPISNPDSVWQGILKSSDNSARGNYMLILDKSLVYINTSRDYSALVGKQVNVRYSGSLESFKLEDITLK